ncbi:MAG TPA: site-specific integrase [Terriglobales bacterium]|nr:site-specific integrase [Terriglobales bacterium]
MTKRARHQQGSVVFDKRRRTWNFLWRDENGARRTKPLGHESDLPTKASARRAAEPHRRQLIDDTNKQQTQSDAPKVKALVESYRIEKMPTRIDTRRSYDVWLRCHVLPKFEENVITDLQARPVEIWLGGLVLSPKSKVHIRGILHLLWDYAMWRGDIPTQRNPMELVSIKGGSKRVKKPRSLTVEEFRLFAQHLPEPFRTIAILCVSLGLRISEALALKWADFDWNGSRLQIERGIVCQNVDEVKTDESGKQMPIAEELLAELKVWHEATDFPDPGDWVFASPVQLGRLPWSYDQIWRVYQKAAKAAGIGTFGTHTLRHTYRSWLDAVGTGIAVQQKLMRHTDIRTTMKYGDVVTDEMEQAHKKVVGLAMSGLQNGLQQP